MLCPSHTALEFGSCEALGPLRNELICVNVFWYLDSRLLKQTHLIGSIYGIIKMKNFWLECKHESERAADRSIHLGSPKSVCYPILSPIWWGRFPLTSVSTRLSTFRILWKRANPTKADKSRSDDIKLSGYQVTRVCGMLERYFKSTDTDVTQNFHC